MSVGKKQNMIFVIPFSRGAQRNAYVLYVFPLINLVSSSP